MFYKKDKNGTVVFVRLTPKAAADRVDGVEQTSDGKQHLAVRVRAVPENGKANKALIKFLAKQWKIPASSIAVQSGDTSRLKQLLFTCDEDMLASALEQYL